MPKKTHLIVVASLLLSSAALTADDMSLKLIMQGLRDNLVEITDGLLTDDFDQVANGAIGIATHPQIPAAQVQLVAGELGEEMPAFKQMDTLVHDLSLEIEAAARTNNGGAALTAYQRMIDGCFACHENYKDRVAAVLAAPTDQ